MNPFRFFALLPLCALLLGCSPSAPAERAQAAPPAISSDFEEELDLGRFFGDIEGTFVLLDSQTGRTVRHNPERARKRFLPASTFKIPNTLIALESGIATGPDFFLAWDADVAPRQAWWPSVWTEDHTLRSALPASVVWYYQELARRIGPERMQGYMDQLEYGNGNISGGIDHFWLTGGLRISPDEQVDFLRRLYFGELGLSERTTRITRDLLVLEETPVYRLSGKTGWAGLGHGSEPDIGWLVGYLERGEDVYFFATNIDIEENEHAAARLPITREILQHLGLIEGAAP